jgi:anti-sigma factor RsiW
MKARASESAVSNTSSHLSYSQLVDLVEGRFTPDDLAEVWPHLSACPRCAADVAWLERVIGLMRADTTEQPPAQVVAAAKSLFRPPAQTAKPAERQQLYAILQFDSARTPLGLGRRAGAQAERQMLFAVSNYLVDIRLVPQGALWQICGQLLGSTDGRQVELQGPAGTTQAALNDLSEFMLPPAPAGTYMLKIQLGDLDILVAELDVGA